MADVRFLRPAPGVVSGGTVYDEAVLRAWPGPAPADLTLGGDWPDGPGTAPLLADALRGADAAIVDGLVGAAHPDVLREAREAGTHVTLLVHLPLPDETGLAPERARDLAATEAASVDLADRVVATSRTAAGDLTRRYGRDDVEVAPPGVDLPPNTAVAQGSSPPLILCLASLTPRKNHETLVSALALLDTPWQAVFAGPAGEEDHARVRRAVDAAGLGERIALPGPVAGAELEALWLRTDVLALPSLAETYGMVVTEAVAHGVPVVVADGTGAVEALTDGEGPDPGLAVDARSAHALATGIRTVLTRPEFRRFAHARRPHLRSWATTAALLARGGPTPTTPDPRSESPR